MPEDNPPLRIGDVVQMVYRRRLVASIAAALAVLAILILPGRLAPATYRAEATLSLERILKPVNFQADPGAGQLPDQLVNTQRELLTSKDVLADALSMGSFRSNPSYAGASDPVAVLAGRLRIAVVRASWVIEVSLDDEDPAFAESGLQSVIDAYRARQTTQTRDRSERDIAYIQDERRDAEAKLKEARSREIAYREQYNISSADPDRNHITVRIQGLAERLAAIDDRIAASEAGLTQMHAADAIADREARQGAYLRLMGDSTTTVSGALQKGLFDCQVEEAELASKYLDKHPKLIDVRSRMAALRDRLDATIASFRSASEADHRALLEQRDSLSKSTLDLQRELNVYRERLNELQRLSQDSAAQQKVLDELLARHAQLVALAGYSDRSLSVVASPHSSPLPRGLGLPATATLAVLAAVVAAVVAAGFADAVDRTVADARQARDLSGTRTLGTVPESRDLPALHDSGPGDPPEIAESMRALWAATRFALGQSPGCRVVLVASPCNGDGRSTVAVRLAASASMAGTATLLIDGDLRSPHLNAELGVPPGNGLSELLAGMPDLAPASTAIPNLGFMPAGAAVGNPYELLNSHCLQEWIGHVRGQYGLVVIDSSAMSGCADALLWTEACDGIVLVLREEATGRAALAAAMEALAPVRERILGHVLVRGS